MYMSLNGGEYVGSMVTDLWLSACLDPMQLVDELSMIYTACLMCQ